MSVEIAAQSQHLKGELRSLIRFYDFFCLFSPAPLVESWFKMQWAMLGRKLGNWMLVAPQLYCHVYALPCLSFRLHRGRAGYNWNLTRVFWSCLVAHFVAFLLCSFLFHPWCGPDKTSVTSQSPSSFLSHLDERRDREWRQRNGGDRQQLLPGQRLTPRHRQSRVLINTLYSDDKVTLCCELWRAPKGDVNRKA